MFFSRPVRIASLVFMGICTTALGELPAEQRKDDTVTAEEFLSLVETAAAQFQTVQLAFHSRYTVPGKSSPHFEQSGRWWFRADGFERLELRDMRKTQEGTASSDKVQIETPGRELNHVIAGKHSASGQAQVRPATPGFFGELTGLPLSVFVLPTLRRQDEEAVRTTFNHEGWEVVDGQKCMKVSFIPLKDAQVRTTYWIDVRRDNQVVRYEWTIDDQRILWFEIDLRQLPNGMWFPTHGRLESHYPEDGSGGWAARPTNSGEVDFDAASVQVNTPLNDNLFAIDDFETGTLVVDQTTGKHYFAGGAAVPGTTSPPPSQQQLDAVLHDADVQKNAVEAPSLARSRFRHWYYWVLGIFSAAGLTVAVILVLRSRWV